jgi:hypothetical protein
MVNILERNGKSLAELPIMSIENPTLAHFRHFSPRNLSPRAAHLTYNRGPRHTSTPVENVRQIRLFMQNKPNLPHFSPENEDLMKKQSQNKPNFGNKGANFKFFIVAKPAKCALYSENTDTK